MSAFFIDNKKSHRCLSHRLRNHSITNRGKCGDLIQCGGVAQAVAWEEGAELVLLSMQSEVVEDNCLYQRVDVVGSAHA